MMPPKSKIINTEKMAGVLNTQYPELSLPDLQQLKSDSPILKDISLKLFNKFDKQCRYYLKRYFLRNTGNLEKLMINKVPDNNDYESAIINPQISTLKNAALLNSINYNELCKESWRSATSKYADLCKTMKIKNSIKNRKKLYMFCKRKPNKRETLDVTGNSKINQNIDPQETNFKNSKFSCFDIDNKECDISERNNTGIIEDNKCLFLVCNQKNKATEINIYEEVEENSGPEFDDINIDKFNMEEPAFVPVSSEKHEIPQEILTLKIYTDTSTILPMNSINMKNASYMRPSFAHCNYFEGSFSITTEEYGMITNQNNNLIPRKYSYFINQKLMEVNTTCKIYFKDSFYSERKDMLTIYAYCIHKQCKSFKIILIDPSKSKNKNIEVKVFSSSLNFNHLQNITSQLRGLERNMVGNLLVDAKPLCLRQDDVLSLNKDSIKIGNLGKVKSDSVYRTLRSEQVSKNDRNKNDFFDLIELQNDHPEYINTVGSPFHIYIFSKEQTTVLSGFKEAILHLDATGSIIRHPCKENKRVYYYAGVIQIPLTKRVCPIFEMVTSNHDAGSISAWLFNFKLYYLTNKNRWPAFTRVVVDFSFAFINAVILAWNNIDLSTYLQVTFEFVHQNKELPPNFIFIHLCCFHIFKLMSTLISDLYPEQDQKILKELVALAFNLDWISFCKWFRYFRIITTSEFQTELVKDALICIGKMAKHSNNLLTDLPKDELVDTKSFSKRNTQFETSAFYQYFVKASNHEDNITLNSNELNPYFNKDFFDSFLKRYIPYVPMWSGVLSGGQRFSNAPVERWFGLVKNHILGGQSNQKCSRVLRKLRKHILFVSKEVIFNIKNRKCTKSEPEPPKESSDIDNNEGLLSQEKWNKKKRMAKPSNFDGHGLTKFLKFEKLEQSQPEPEIQNVHCVYCRNYNDEHTHGHIEWLGCDKCGNWMHSSCARKIGLCLSSDPFLCTICCQNIDQSNCLQNDIKNITPFDATAYTFFIKSNFTKSLVEINEIEIKTRGQRKTEDWINERKIRITASKFGAICKARTEKRLISLVSDIINPISIEHIPSIRHGITNEERALEEYKNITGSTCYLSGLQVHPDFQFIAGSPDGLVNSEGLLEIKCPFLIRNEHPLEAIRLGKLPYCDSNGELRVNSDYYFQVQGLMAITHREWCDFFIYTPKGTHVQRINKNPIFWKNILMKLKSFYYDFMVPSIVASKIIDQPIKWTTAKPIHLLDNGLVNDPKFYLVNLNKRFYISFYSKATCEIKEITREDYSTLTDKNWLSNFVVDILFNIINSKTNFCNLITCNLATSILYNKQVSDYIMDQIHIFENDLLVMPLLLNNNHFCLALADFNAGEFIYLDPYGNENISGAAKNIYANFLMFLKTYSAYKNKTSLCKVDFKLITKKHTTQTDSYNCGIYIIYFFKQICENQSLEWDVNADELRKELLLQLLSNSDDVSERCIYCGNIKQNDAILRCNSCKRFAHLKEGCADSKEFNYGLCNLCKSY